MADGLTIPKVGTVPKKVLIPVVLVAAGYVGWRYYQASKNGTGADPTATDTGDFGTVDPLIPDTLNPYPSSFTSGGTGTGTTGGDTNQDGIIGPGEFTTNGQWTEYVTEKLQQSDTWSYTDIVTALGNGLAGRPTTDAQQAILRAAIAVGGYPPTGTLTIVGGGNTALTTAPAAQRATSTQNTAAVYFSGVSGATSYQVFESGISSPVGAGTGSPITVAGLQPGVSYSFQVAGVTGSGQVGPKSNTVKVRTTTYSYPAPGTPSISGVTAHSAAARVATVANAEEYVWILNGLIVTMGGPSYTFTNLKPNTRYSVQVAARAPHQNAGPRSKAATFTTKKK